MTIPYENQYVSATTTTSSATIDLANPATGTNLGSESSPYNETHTTSLLVGNETTSSKSIMYIGEIAGANRAALAHKEQVDSGKEALQTYALYQDFSGNTRLNAAANTTISFCINDIPGARLQELQPFITPAFVVLGQTNLQGKVTINDDLEIGEQDTTPSYTSSTNVTGVDKSGRPLVVKTGIIPQYYNRAYNGGTFRYKLVADFQAQIDIGQTKGATIQNRNFQIRCGQNQYNGNLITWELATGESQSNYEYLHIGWKDFAAPNTYAGWWQVNIAGQDRVNINGGTVGVLVTGAGGLKVNGNSVAVTSDRRIKKNITDASGAYALVASIPIRSYDYVDTTRQPCKYGFIAQEVEAVMPQAIETVSGDFDALGNYVVQNPENAVHNEIKYVKKDQLFQLLFSAFKESQAKIASLEERLLAVESKV